MDAVTAAGLGLSIVSLAFQVFSGCIQGYQLLLNVADMPNQFEHIRVRLRLEQARLLTWGDRVGLLEEILEEPSIALQLHRNLIFDLLLEVSRLFKSCLKVESNFAALAISSSTFEADRTLRGSTAPPSKRVDQLLVRALNAVTKVAEVPKRFEWAMVKQDKFLNLTEQLISYNDSMMSLLDGASLQQIHHVQFQSHLALLQLSTKIDDLRQLTQAMQIRPNSVGLRASASHRPAGSYVSASQAKDITAFDDGPDLAHLAAFKADRLHLEQDLVTADAALIDMNDVEIIATNSRIDIAKFKGENVWIEWKETDQENLNPWYKQVVETRVKKLAALLAMHDMPKEFRAPQCLGCLYEIEDDMVRYGFVNKMPPKISETILPRPLIELLRHEPIPSLSQRIRLAGLLAKSLMYLHSVNWLHKGVRSENIVFFPREDGSIDYNSPIVSGFDFARPDRPDEMTDKPLSSLEKDVYQHPYSIDHPKERSRKSWDIYSLGIVLIEIAAWKAIHEVVGIDFKHHTAKSKVRRVKTFLLQDDFMDKIGAQCGDRYKEIVKRCLIGGLDMGIKEDADESDPEVGSEMMQVFARDVVDVLQNIQL